MKKISYTVKDALGLHARPAGLLAKLAKEYPDASITVTPSSVDHTQGGGISVHCAPGDVPGPGPLARGTV